MIGKVGERSSWISVQIARHDDDDIYDIRAGLAQSVERSARNHKVPSSIPVLANSAYE